jgi:hypothetical protein
MAASLLSVSTASQTNFSAQGIDVGILPYEASDTRNVVYQ